MRTERWLLTDSCLSVPSDFPVMMLATRKIRDALGLSVPNHPLFEQPVCGLADVNIDRGDPFFHKVDQLIAKIAPNDDFKWPW